MQKTTRHTTKNLPTKPKQTAWTVEEFLVNCIGLSAYGQHLLSAVLEVYPQAPTEDTIRYLETILNNTERIYTYVGTVLASFEKQYNQERRHTHAKALSSV